MGWARRWLVVLGCPADAETPFLGSARWGWRLCGSRPPGGGMLVNAEGGSRTRVRDGEWRGGGRKGALSPKREAPRNEEANGWPEEVRSRAAGGGEDSIRASYPLLSRNAVLEALDGRPGRAQTRPAAVDPWGGSEGNTVPLLVSIEAAPPSPLSRLTSSFLCFCPRLTWNGRAEP